MTVDMWWDGCCVMGRLLVCGGMVGCWCLVGFFFYLVGRDVLKCSWVAGCWYVVRWLVVGVW